MTSEVKETEVCGLIAGFMMSYGISPEKLCHQLHLLSGSFRIEFCRGFVSDLGGGLLSCSIFTVTAQ